jgi:hypothetical protein
MQQYDNHIKNSWIHVALKAVSKAPRIYTQGLLFGLDFCGHLPAPNYTSGKPPLSSTNSVI